MSNDSGCTSCLQPIGNLVDGYLDRVPTYYQECVVNSFFYGAVAKFVTTLSVKKDLFLMGKDLAKSGGISALATTIQFLITPILLTLRGGNHNHDHLLDAVLHKGVISICLTGALALSYGWISQAMAVKIVLQNIGLHLLKSAVQHFDLKRGSDALHIDIGNSVVFLPFRIY